MAGHKYLNSSGKLFDDEDDDDTDENSYTPQIPTTQARPVTAQYNGRIAELERQRQALLQRQREIGQRTLDSSNRSIGLLRESEEVGVQAAVELIHQREQLETTNKRLDEINTNLNISQKHLNGIKSVFSGLKNYISRKSKYTPARSQTSPDPSSTKGRGSGLVDTINNFNNDTTPENQFSAHPSACPRDLDHQTMAEPVSDSQYINKLLDDNLEEMVQHLTKLKGLGVDLGREIDTQNELIDNIQDKVEVVDIKIKKQNKTMNKLLGK